jgi:hypothetical protein
MVWTQTNDTRLLEMHSVIKDINTTHYIASNPGTVPRTLQAHG